MIDNDFLSIDLTKTWSVASPVIQGYAQSSGPPPVANGYLWASYDSLFLYGGEFSDAPATSPSPESTWEYRIASNNWIEHSDPTTAVGVNAPSDDQPVQRTAEGAGISFAALGRGWYFGGHQDGYTVPGWSQSVARIYLTSLLEYTFPGYTNSEVTELAGGTTAGSDGVYRNVTDGDLASQAGFPEVGDSALVYIPSYGADGLLLSLAGGNNATFTQMNIIDIYDVATSSWYKQATTGTAPSPRANPCAAVAAAADGSSYQVYMFAGQQLQPAGSQAQYDDTWILSIPSFTWMEVDTSKQSVPPGRSGHTCNIWDGQMVVVGGYVGDIGCEYPGTYVFNVSSLEWQNNFIPTSDEAKNPQSQQEPQIGKTYGLPGSYGYEVPSQLQSAIGGGPSGGATATSPNVGATAGPLATGTPLSYPVSGGTEPSGGSSNSGGNSGSNKGSNGNNGSNQVGAIVAGVIAGVAGIVAIYLAFVAVIYRKRMKEYKKNVDTFGWVPSKENSREESVRGRSRDGEYEPVQRQRRTSSADLLGGREPTFVGIMLHPRRSLRVTNPD